MVATVFPPKKILNFFIISSTLMTLYEHRMTQYVPRIIQHDPIMTQDDTRMTQYDH